MPIIQCPIEDCEYKTPDVEAVIAAALITTHATSHGSALAARAEKVKRPSVSIWDNRGLAIFQVKVG